MEALEKATIVKEGWIQKRGSYVSTRMHARMLISDFASALLPNAHSRHAHHPGEFIKNWRPRWFQLKSDGTFRGYVCPFSLAHKQHRFKTGPPAPNEPIVNYFDVAGRQQYHISIFSLCIRICAHTHGGRQRKDEEVRVQHAVGRPRQTSTQA